MALPGFLKEVPIAELFAFVMAITHSFANSIGQFTFHTDCKWVIDSFEAGWTRCTVAMHVRVALWRRLFRLVDDRFEECQNGQDQSSHERRLLRWLT